MLKISSKSSYAVRALIHLARHSIKNAIRAQDISNKENIPAPFLEQIFSKLKKAGIIEAIRGPHGGFRLAKTPQEITLANIVTVLEGPIEPVLCSMPENRTPDCHEVEGCCSRHLCNELDGAILGTLNKHTIGSMSQEANRLEKIQFIH